MSLNEVTSRYYSISRLMETLTSKMPIKSDVKVFTSRVYENEFSNSAVISGIQVNGVIQTMSIFFDDTTIKYLQIPRSTPNNFKIEVNKHEVTIHPNKKTFQRNDNTVVSYYDYEVKSL